MKATLVILFLTINSICHSQSNLTIERAHKNVTTYMKKKLNDPSSYKPVSFYGLVKIYSNLDTENVRKPYENQIAELQEAKLKMDRLRHAEVIKVNDFELLQKDTIYLKAKNYIVQDNKAIERLKNLEAEYLSQAKANFIPTIIGYRMRHVFRAKNAFNATILSSWDFILNKSGEIVSVETRSYDEQMRDAKEEYLKKIGELN